MKRVSLWKALEPVAIVAIRRRWHLLWVCCFVCSLLVGGGTHLAFAAEEAELSYAKGIIAYDNRNYLDALDLLRRVLMLEPDNAAAHFYLGLALSRIGEYTEAITALERALLLDSSMQYAHHHLGIVYFQEGRYEPALKHFTQAVQFDPQKATTQFYLAKTHYQLKRYDDALPPLQQTLQLVPDQTASVQYYRGLVLNALERDEEAQEAFGAVVAANPESAIARNAQQYMDAIKRRQHERRVLQVQAAIRYQYDDNVVLEPLDETLAVSAESDSRMVFTLAAQLLPVGTPQWRLGGEYTLYQSKHFHLHDFDVQSHTAGLVTRFQRDRVTLRLGANYNITYLGSTLFTDYDRFSEAFTVYSRAIIQQTQTLFVAPSVRYRLNNFFDITPDDTDPAVRDQDGWSVRAGFDQYVAFNKRRSYARLGYAYEGSRNDGSDWKFDSHQVQLGLHTPLWAGLALHAVGGFTRYDYLHVNSFDADSLGELDSDDQDKRHDTRVIGSVTLTRALGRFLTLSLGFEHIRNFSNIPFFDYRRNVWTLALSGKV